MNPEIQANAVDSPALQLPPRTAVETSFDRESFERRFDIAVNFDAMRALFSSNTSAQIGAHARFDFEVPDGHDYYMPAAIDGIRATKWIRSRPANTANGMERSQSSMLLTDDATGVVLGFIDSTTLTPWKAALVTMVGLSQWISQCKPEKITLGVYGGGGVARGHLIAAQALFPELVRETLVFSPRESAAKLVKDLAYRNPCELADEATLLERCNVILGCTAAREPVLTADALLARSTPKFVAGVGFSDIGADCFEKADAIVSEDPFSYAKSKLKLADYLRAHPSRTLIGLSEVINGTDISQCGLTLFMPYGTAMADLQMCMTTFGIKQHTQTEARSL